MRSPAPVLALLLALSACGGARGSPVALAGETDARRWGDGPYGLVLVSDAGRDPASWDAAARRFADDGMTVLAMGGAASEVEAALRHLLDEVELERAALLAAGAGTQAALAVAASQPRLVDQLILISARGDVSGLAEFPKLFVASHGEDTAGDAQRMADEARGAWNDLYLAEGDASGQEILDGPGGEGAMEAILRRLHERR